MLEALRESIQFSLKSLKKANGKGYQIATEEGRKLYIHYLLSAYAGDIPEAEDLLGVKKGDKKINIRHMCYVN